MLLVHNKGDEQLIKDCLKNKRSAQEALYAKFSARMHAVCRLYTRDPDTANEMLQEGFIKVFRSLKQYDGSGAFEGWMRRVFVRVAIDIHRRNHQYRHQIELTEEQADAHLQLSERNHALGIMEKEDFDQILAEIPAGYRMIINLYVVEGYNHREIGEVLGISEGTSKSQYSKAKRFLRKIIGKHVDEGILERYEKRSS